MKYSGGCIHRVVVFLEIKYMLYCVEKFINQSGDCMEKCGPSTVASVLRICMLT